MKVQAIVLVIALSSQATHQQEQKLSCPPCECVNNGNKTVVDCQRKINSTLPNFNETFSKVVDTLLLGHNNLTYIGRADFCKFEGLRQLDISFNAISILNSGAFSGLRNLKYLSLERNYIDCGHRITNAFKPLVMLETLKLNGNVVSEDCAYPDKSLKDLKSLNKLYIDGRNAPFSHHFKDLTNLQHLYLSESKSYCHIGNIYNNTFKFLPNLTHLNISHCSLTTIDWDAFSHLRSLRMLDVSDNPGLGLNALERITFGIQSTNIQDLYVNHIVPKMEVCVIIYPRLIKNLQNTSLEELHAKKNRIELFSNGALLLLPQTLSKLQLKENRLTFGPYLKDSASLAGLEEIDISGHPESRDMPEMDLSPIQDGDTTPRCPTYDACQRDIKIYNLQHLRYFIAEFKDVPHRTYVLPPNLKRLRCSFYQLSYNITEITFKENSLRYLDLSSNLFSSWTGPIHGLENLTHLDLANNIAFHMNFTFLERFYALETLNISFNTLGKDISNDTGQMFKNLNNLKVLDLSYNFIVGLKPRVFSGLRSLEMLNLSNNNIHALFIKVSHMTNLRSISCHKNQVRWIPPFLVNDLDNLAKRQKLTFDLSKNPIACTCENLHLLHWFLYPPYKLKFGNLSNYFCIYNDGHTTELTTDIYENLRMKCHYFYVIAQCVFAMFFLTISGILSAVAYRYRWKLLYWYYAIRLKYSRPVDSRVQGKYEFDAFVSFADEDREFVVGDLVKYLEEESDLKLNIHQRDFTPGRSIAQNIVNAVQVSRHTLVILSEDFLASRWCRYELEMANMEESMTERDVILIVMYRPVETKQIPSEVTFHIMKDSYIEFPRYGNTDVFWKTLTDALQV